MELRRLVDRHLEARVSDPVPAPIRGNPARIAVGLAGLLFLAAIPLLSVRVPPLFDYPNHLARMHVLLQAGRSAALDTYYQVRWSALPNLAMDLVVPWLGRVMPLDGAGRVFIFLVLALLGGGAVLLHRAAWRRWTPWPLMVGLLFYNRILLWGFLNYLAGVGVALIGAAFWLLLANRRPLRLEVVALLATAAYFSHIIAFALMGIMILGIELPGLWARRERLGEVMASLVEMGLPFLPGIALWLATWHPGPGEGGGTVWANPFRKLDLLFSIFDNYHRGFDVACFAAVVIGLLVALWRRWFKVEPRLMAAALLTILVYLVMPSRFLGGTGADHRLPLVIFILLVTATEPEGWPRKARMIVAASLGLLLVTRLALVEVAWLAADWAYAPILAALETLPKGTRLGVGYGTGAVNVTAVPLVHLPSYAVITADAFVPTEFTFAGQQPLAFKPPYDRLAAEAGPGTVWDAAIKQGNSLAVLDSFDAVALLDRQLVPPATAACLTPIYQSPIFALYGVRHGEGGCGGAG